MLISRFPLIAIFILSLFCFCIVEQTTNQPILDSTPPPEIAEFPNKILNVGMPIIIKDMTSVSPRFNQVIDYGKFIRDFNTNNIDSLTIRSDLYWKAYITMSPNNPNVYFSRIFLLCGQGLLKRAEYVLAFAMYHSDLKREDNRFVFDKVKNGIRKTTDLSDKYVEDGIKQFDMGNTENALALYNKALEIYPKNPWATYEIGLTEITANIKNSVASLLDSSSGQKKYALVREYDPFYQVAYQGKREIFKNMLPIMNKINPNLEIFYSGKATPMNFHEIAAGCEEMGQYEFAAYAYHHELLMKFKTKFDIDIAESIARCIRALGCSVAADYFLQQVKEFNK
jgi:tetratricopeptide (TPR) repeat protein